MLFARNKYQKGMHAPYTVWHLHTCSIQNADSGSTADSLVACGSQITMDWEMGDAVTEFRLVDVPELGYHTTDKPFPRGELQLTTQSMIKGYHKQAKARCLSPGPACCCIKNN